MRILVDGMPRTKGGIGSLIINIAEYCKKRYDKGEMTFEFIIAGESGYLPFLEKNGYKYYISPPVHNIREYRRFLNRLFDENTYDYLWFNNTSKVNILLPSYAKKRGTKLIAHPHGVDIEEKGIKRIIFMILNQINRRKMFILIDVPFACSAEAADVYYKGSVSLRNRAVIIRNGINADIFSFSQEKRKTVREALSIGKADKLLGAVGRLTAVKNYPFLIRLLQQMDTHYKMILIGDGEDRSLIENLIKENKLMDRCFLLGVKENVQDYLFAMDVFLMPSFNEGMPFSIIEAQCSGLPCVVSDTLSQHLKITDLVQYVAIDDPQKWVAAIIGCKTNAAREAYKEEVIAAGYGIKQSFSMFMRAIKPDEASDDIKTEYMR